MTPTLQGIDHVHVYVSDRAQAARWYEEVLGFAPTAALAHWAEDIQGPLTIEDASGTIHLALFQREEFEPGTAIAFKADGPGFLQWQQRLEDMGVPLECKDHQLAWSLYFQDPDGNLHEITSYDYDLIAASKSQ